MHNFPSKNGYFSLDFLVDFLIYDDKFLCSLELYFKLMRFSFVVVVQFDC